jgi:Fe-S cluster assembly protein SufB
MEKEEKKKKNAEILTINEDYKDTYGFHDSEDYMKGRKKGLSKELIADISKIKGEPQWMLDFRLKSLEIFQSKPTPNWAHFDILDNINYDDIYYYARATDKLMNKWEDVPDKIKETFDRLGVPEAERKFLAGVSAQYESEVVYHSIKEELSKQGVIFLDIDSGLREFPDLFKEYFATVIPPDDNKLAALNSAAWSGGSFIYVPKGVKVGIPLQAYFRINAENIGQFERTLIITDEGSSVHYIEGCTAPIWSTDSLHTGVIELIAREGSHLRYTTIQNWSGNVYNLVTQRAKAYKNALVEWMDGNIGSKMTMKYPSVFLLEEGAKGNVVSIGYAGKGQLQDAGTKMYHFAPKTSSFITAKSISKDGGRASYRGLVKVHKEATDVKSKAECDALLLDDESRSDTYPTIEIEGNQDVNISHEATVGKISDEEIFYLRSRGLSEKDATLMIVNGFIEEFTKELPMEYAVELNRLIELEMEGSIG